MHKIVLRVRYITLEPVYLLDVRNIFIYFLHKKNRDNDKKKKANRKKKIIRRKQTALYIGNHTDI
jgi:hypothetical protein